MKKLLLLCMICSTFVFANDDKTKTQLKEVTVYLDGAQITRTASIMLNSGPTEFTFGKLSPHIQESSIQISGLKNASILSINYGINYLSKQDHSEEIKDLQDQIKELNDKIQFEDDLISGYNEELQVIQSNRRLGNETQVVSLEKLQQFAAYYRERLTSIRNDIYASEKKKRTLRKDIQDMSKQLLEFNVDDKVQTGEIKVKLNSSETTNLGLIIKYNVSNAGWFPIYDLKAEKINAPLQLAYKAHVYQKTGNDWKDIKLTLSTSDPNTNNLKPDVNPKYLNFISHNSRYQSNRATRSYNYKYNPLINTVSGTVIGSDGLPIPGINIIEKGTSNGTQSDFDGNFSLNVGTGKELVFSYVGMKTETLPIHSSTMNVTMEDDMTMLEEVVVIAQGVRRERKSLGYAVSEIRSDNIESDPTNIARVLSGKVSGVQITSASGSSGSGTSVKIRGYNSTKRNKDALFVVDGIPFGKGQAGRGRFANINPDDIANIQVLKGLSASTLYGNQGRNGVIVITTKKGRSTSNGDVIEEGITNTRFEIKKAYSIPTDGDITVIEIENYEVPADYAYFAAPVLNENVFLTAKIGNWEQYNLLPAEANVYFEGSYSGKTNINPQATTDSLTVSLGVDPNVVVKRNQLNDFKKQTFLGNNKVINKAYEIELKNNKQANISLVLFDRIPISQNKEIKIDDIETGTSKYDDKKGIMEWKVNLSGKSSRTYKFSYSIKYPKYKRVNL